MSVPQTGEFIAEAKEHLADVCDQLLRLERASGEASRDHVERMLRAIHSVKGGAGFFGLRNIEQLAHRMETALEAQLSGTVARDSRMVDTFLFATDRIAALLDDVDHSQAVDVSDVMSRLDELLTTAHVEAVDASESVLGLDDNKESAATEVISPVHRFAIAIDLSACQVEGVAPSDVVDRVLRLGQIIGGTIECLSVDLHQSPPADPVMWHATIESPLAEMEFHRRLGLPSAGARPDQAATAVPQSDGTAESETTAGTVIPVTSATPVTSGAIDRASTIRIPVDVVDRLMNLAGELVLVRNQSRRFAEANQPLPGSVVQRLDAVTGEFQETVLQTRMQPVGNLFSRFPRLVRDLARQLGKQMEVQIEGAEVELDKTILDAVSDPLTHLVRNACDHGIERPDEREQQGKPPAGRISLTARHFGDQIRITVSDDGRGIDRVAIRRQALKLRLRTVEELERLDDRDLLYLVLLPGFSTATQVTDVSGRGVGMDVVATNLAQLGGNLEIDSRVGLGTTFTLRLPLTMAIIPSLLVAAAGQRYAIPQKDLEELVYVDAERTRVRIERTKDQTMVRLRGRLLPLVHLTQLLRAWTNTDGASTLVVQDWETPFVFAVVKSGSRRYGLAIDSVLTSEEIVVKPMHSRLRDLAVYSGATILGDGRVALIVNTEGIAAVAKLRFGTDAEIQSAVTGQHAAETQTLLLLRQADGEPLAVPTAMVRRIVMVHSDKLESVNNKRYVSIDGVPTRLIPLRREEAPIANRIVFVLLPRCAGEAVGFMVPEVLGAEQINSSDLRSISGDPATLGAAIIRGRITPILDLQRLLDDRLFGEAPAAATRKSAIGPKVLVVDDTQFFRDLVGRLFAENGYTVTTAEHGAAALELLERESFDIVVSDLEMPVMDGWTLASQVRRNAAWRDMPLLALTTLDGDDARSKALSSGFDAYEVKLDRDSLVAAASRLLKQRHGNNEPAEVSHA